MEEMVRELTPQGQENLQWEVTLRNEVQGTNGIRVLPSNSEEINFEEWESLFYEPEVKTDFQALTDEEYQAMEDLKKMRLELYLR